MVMTVTVCSEEVIVSNSKEVTVCSEEVIVSNSKEVTVCSPTEIAKFDSAYFYVISPNIQT